MMAAFEKNLGEFLAKTMRDPTYMQLVAKNMESSLDVRGAVKAQIERAMKAFNIPTEESMGGLYQTVHNLETRLLDLEEKVDDLVVRLDAIRPAASPPPPPQPQPKAGARPAARASKAKKRGRR
jgi:hypothetical protein